MSSGYFGLMWQQAEEWRLIIAFICGFAVGLVYFYSLRWSISHQGEFAHKFKVYALVALCRIALFFGVLILIGHRNIAVILLYILAFFLTKVAIIWFEKKRYLGDDTPKGEKKQ